MIPSQESYGGWRRRSRQTWRHLSPIHSLGSLKSRDIEELIMVRQCDVCSANYFARRRNSRYCPDRCRKRTQRSGVPLTGLPGPAACRRWRTADPGLRHNGVRAAEDPAQGALTPSVSGFFCRAFGRPGRWVRIRDRWTGPNPWSRANLGPDRCSSPQSQRPAARSCDHAAAESSRQCRS